MNILPELKKYEHEFQNKITFYYFVTSNKLSHFESPLKEDLSLFSNATNCLDVKLAGFLDNLAEKFNSATNDAERLKAARNGVYGVRALY